MATDAKIVPAEKQESESPVVQSSVPTVAARLVGDVLPQTFYAGASQLAVSDEEAKSLRAFRVAPDDELEIRPDDGAVYAPHSWYERALTDVFGYGQWAIVPGSPVSTDPEGWVYQRWVLVVRGCYIAETIGQARYVPNNARSNKALAVESARSDAIPRLCAKGSLAVGANPWNRRLTEKWRRENAVKVKVRDYSGRIKSFWRRNDADPLDGEIAPEPDAETEALGIEMEPEIQVRPDGFALESQPAPMRVMTATYFRESETYRLAADKALIDAHQDLLRPFRRNDLKAYVLTADELETLKLGLLERGVKIIGREK